jgi:AraC-like DNA-binding protein
MDLRVAAPDRRLASFVRCFAHRETTPSSPAFCQAVIGALEHILSFEFCDRAAITHYPAGEATFYPRIFLRGAKTRCAGHDFLSGHVVSFGIFFQPFALWQLFGIPPAELTDVEDDATALMGRWVVDLWHRLACVSTFSGRMNVAAEALMKLVETARPLTSIMSTVHLLLPSDDTIRITKVAHRSAMSIRSYERQFAGEIGMSPKQFVRVARFAAAIDLKRKSNRSWLNIAQELGYFDQMHMIREFRILGGDTPGRLVHPYSDFQPWSVQDALV